LISKQGKTILQSSNLIKNELYNLHQNISDTEKKCTSTKQNIQDLEKAINIIDKEMQGVVSQNTSILAKTDEVLNESNNLGQINNQLQEIVAKFVINE